MAKEYKAIVLGSTLKIKFGKTKKSSTYLFIEESKDIKQQLAYIIIIPRIVIFKEKI